MTGPNVRMEISPSGKYKLAIIQKPTKPGCWDYSVGTVFRGEEQLFAIERNYHSFPFAWVEGHPNGHDYFICGADYQGQTVLELDTGRRRDVSGGDPGFGFCWSSYDFNLAQQCLLVAGCYWACPYEYKFYDFSAPMEQGWPEIIAPDDEEGFYMGKDPDVDASGFTIWETRRVEPEDPEADDIEQPVAWKKFRREGLQLVKIDEWVAEAEQKLRAEEAARREAWEAAWKEYKATDLLYRCAMESFRGCGFEVATPVDGVYIGQCYAGWCPDFTEEDQRIGRRLYTGRKMRTSDDRVTADLEWGRNKAPVKLILYKNGASWETRWFPHSVEGIEQAFFEAARLVLPPGD